MKFYNYTSAKRVKFSRYNSFYKIEVSKKSLNSIRPFYNIYKDFEIYTKYHIIKKDDIILDLGANIGVISLYFSTFLGEKGFVYSIESDNYNLKLFKKNLKINSKYRAKIRLDNVLIWSTNTTIKFHQDSSVSSSIFYKGKNSKTVNRKTITLDSWAIDNKISKIDFIKMDIEGSEIEAIKGAKKIIENFKPNFAIASYHNVNGEPTYIELKKIFDELKYPNKTIENKYGEIITYAGECVNI